MEKSAAAAKTASVFTRLREGCQRLDVRHLAIIKVEDMALAGGYFALCLLLAATNISSTGNVRVAGFASAWLAFAVLGCAGVLFRRAAPTAMAWMCSLAVIGLLVAGHAGAYVLVFELFFSLVMFAPAKASRIAARSAWALAALLVLAAYAFTYSLSGTLTAAVVAVVTLLTPVEWAGNLRKANLLAASESARADAVHEAAEQRLLSGRGAHALALEQERAHMARELHDVISARLSAIALQSGAVLQSGAAPDAPHTALLRQVRNESVAGLEELNNMIRLLHTGALTDMAGRLSDLPGLVRQYQGAGTELLFSNSLDDAGEHLPLQLQTAVYRVAAEALVNATRHAPGERITVALSGGPAGTIALTVANPLPRSSNDPAVPRGSTGTGLPSMHFRAAHAGGTVAAGPCQGHWMVALRLPVPGATASSSASSTERNSA
ncbi:MAG: histidine kinase [Specibacter sp.]